MLPRNVQGAHGTHGSQGGNLLEGLPVWLGLLPLTELQLGDPHTSGWSASTPAHAQLRKLGLWLARSPEDALPHSLRHLS